MGQWTKKLTLQKVKVSLPKFTFSFGGSLRRQLQEMGMKEAFTDHADFSGMTSHPSSLMVTDVIQKTFIAMDETGTEAAAATAVATRNGVSSHSVFRADHPFLFAIRDTKAGKILFLGRVTNPKRN